MINRLAVILIGQYRTWPICAQYQFDFFAKKAKQIDYFFITWNTNSIFKDGFYFPTDHIITENDIIKFFANQTLVNFKILDDIKETNTYYRMAHLSKIGSTLKQSYEQDQGFIYDQVVETRPDIIFIDNQDTLLHEWVICNDNEYSGGDILWEPELLVEDTYFRTNSLTHNILSSRLETRFDIGPKQNFHHASMAMYLLKHNICRQNVSVRDYSYDQVIRDNKCMDLDLLTVSKEELFKMNFRQW